MSSASSLLALGSQLSDLLPSLVECGGPGDDPLVVEQARECSVRDSLHDTLPHALASRHLPALGS